jgi:hypothetical protein
MPHEEVNKFNIRMSELTPHDKILKFNFCDSKCTMPGVRAHFPCPPHGSESTEALVSVSRIFHIS